MYRLVEIPAINIFCFQVDSFGFWEIYRIFASRYFILTCFVGLSTPLKIAIIELANPVAVVSIRGLRVVPQSPPSAFDLIFLLRVIRNTIENVRMLISTIMMNMKGIEIEAKLFCGPTVSGVA